MFVKNACTGFILIEVFTPLTHYIVTTRQTFTDTMISTLQTGADNLTLADTNEEGANLLMLQTRQSLGTSSLSMSSQSAQAVLKLF